jgi:hypothetical protein
VSLLDLEFCAELHFWRGPSPYHFLAVPPEGSADIAAVAASVTYGWGVIPVTVRTGRSTWTTSLFPKDGRYLVPLKAAVRAVERIGLGDVVTLRLTLGRADDASGRRR